MYVRSLVVLACAACTHPLYDTTTHYGGTVSLRLAPIGEGVGVEVDGAGAPALEDLASCRSHLMLQEPRRAAEAEPNRVLDLCFASVSVEGPCFAEAAEVELVVAHDAALVSVRPVRGDELQADLGSIPGFEYEPEGSMSATVAFEDAACVGAGEHDLEATWAFDRSETYKEGRVRPFDLGF